MIFSCGIESIEVQPKLNPPMGLTAGLVSNKIRLIFYALNDESYFTGYYIYINESENEILSTNGIPVPNENGETNKPTIYVGIPFYEERTFTNFVSFYSNSETPLINNQTYYFMVRSYSETYNIFSRFSKIAKIKYTNM